MLICVSLDWAPLGFRGRTRVLYVRASSTVDFYAALGEALAREAVWLGENPTRHEVLSCIRSIDSWAEPGDVADAWLLTPPELVKGYSEAFDPDQNPQGDAPPETLRPKRKRRRKPWLR